MAWTNAWLLVTTWFNCVNLWDASLTGSDFCDVSGSMCIMLILFPCENRRYIEYIIITEYTKRKDENEKTVTTVHAIMNT